MRERPNRDALNRAVDVFRDAMRPFIVRHVKRVRGVRVGDVIRGSLQGNRADSFEQNLRDGRNVEDSIDVNDFPHIVKRHWREVFNNAFGGKRTVENALWQIADARNQAAHPGTEDLELEYVRSRLYDVAEVLGRINAPREKLEVEEIRDGLVGGAGAPPRRQEIEDLASREREREREQEEELAEIERERERERRHEEELREIERERERERRQEEELAEIERERERERRQEEELREIRRRQEIEDLANRERERQRDLLGKQDGGWIEIGYSFKNGRKSMGDVPGWVKEQIPKYNRMFHTTDRDSGSMSYHFDGGAFTYRISFARVYGGADVRVSRMLMEESSGGNFPPEGSYQASEVSRPDARPQRPGGYWVYEDRPTSRARVHEGTCRYCNHGDGMGKGRIEAESEWYGPFVSREDAFRRAGATGQRDVRGCGVCRP